MHLSKTLTLLLALFSINSCFAQSEFNFAYSRSFTTGGFNYSQKSQYQGIEYRLGGLHGSDSYIFGYSYFIKPEHGFEFQTSMNVYNFDFEGQGEYILHRQEFEFIGIAGILGGGTGPFREYTAVYRHVGSTINTLGISLSYHWRPNPIAKKLFWDHRVGISFENAIVNEPNVEKNGENSVLGIDPNEINSFNAQLGNYYGLYLEPSFIWKWGKSINFRLGLPVRVLFLENSDFPVKSVWGLSAGFMFRKARVEFKE